MQITDNENSFYQQASRMNANRKASDLPTSIAYCYKVLCFECELTPAQQQAYINTLNKF